MSHESDGHLDMPPDVVKFLIVFFVDKLLVMVQKLSYSVIEEKEIQDED